ncbi:MULTISPECIES: hypothetical protein [Halorussus]|uniref:hypothetical protein n=1 Tax=Halorussus TaxID=1070314 RepID=UPI00209CEECF|nr:hypothetical protein [Halorussus vallis]USZ76887.1 hypothetical protein NGM07_06045 [Halorussus vallis]
MTGVRYYCPRCGSVATLDRDAYLADKCVTPTPLEGWEYAAVYEEYERADGVEIVCGASETEGEGCGDVYYLSFVKYEDGDEVDPAERSFVPPTVDGPSIPSDDSDDDGPRFDFRP